MRGVSSNDISTVLICCTMQSCHKHSEKRELLHLKAKMCAYCEVGFSWKVFDTIPTSLSCMSIISQQ